MDARVWFALCNFSMSHPGMVVYYADTVEKQLDKALETFAAEQVSTDVEQTCVRTKHQRKFKFSL